MKRQILYRVFEYPKSENNSLNKCYGIEAYCGDVSVYKTADLSTDYALMCEFAARLNRDKLELVHLEQIIEDFLIDFEIPLSEKSGAE